MVQARKVGTGRHGRVQAVLYRQSGTGIGHGTGRQSRYRQTYPGTGSHIQYRQSDTGSPIQAVRYRQSDTGSPIQAVGYRHTGHGTGRQDMVLADKSEYRQIAPGTGRQSRVQVDMAGCMQT
jgi:hypothetical protein